ncbi:MAG: hypothetical protein HYT79_09360 [Elusimicrobia bacterium]|nr:hypothetical protein [Elusimicrobiota bacterium]
MKKSLSVFLMAAALPGWLWSQLPEAQLAEAEQVFDARANVPGSPRSIRIPRRRWGDLEYLAFRVKSLQRHMRMDQDRLNRERGAFLEAQKYNRLGEKIGFWGGLLAPQLSLLIGLLAGSWVIPVVGGVLLPVGLLAAYLYAKQSQENERRYRSEVVQRAMDDLSDSVESLPSQVSD